MLFEQAYVCYEKSQNAGMPLFVRENLRAIWKKTGQEREQLSFILLSRYYNLILAV